MKILVTGANGLLGHHVVNELLNRGEKVRIIVRSVTQIFFDLSKVEVITGNFNDKNTLHQAAEGCDSIIHIAAITSTELTKYREYKSINYDACRTLLEVSDSLNIQNIVFVSTANTIGFGCKKVLADEKWLFEYPFKESFYAKSKFKAEKLFINYAKNQKDKHIIIINPTFMIGSQDVKPSSGKMILMGYKKKLMFVPNGGKNFVAVNDVAVACCNALTHGVSGEKYLAAGINLSFKNFYKLMKNTASYKQKILTLPDFILILAGYSGDILRFFKIKTSLCTRNINQLLIREYYTNKKAVEVLKMPETPLETAVQEAISWFSANHKIKN
jgi:nucleoside-diphosphate-sugar epimerase